MRAPLEHEIAELRRQASVGEIDCLPFKEMVSYVANWSYNRGDVEFNAGQLREIIVSLSLSSPRSGKPLRPSVEEVHAALCGLGQAGKLALIHREGAFRLPWSVLEQEWQLTLQASDAPKAERLFERISRRVGRTNSAFLSPSTLPGSGVWAAGFRIRLLSVSWPCAVSEALRYALSLHPSWSLETNEHGVCAGVAKSPTAPIHSGKWRIATSGEEA